MVRRAGPADADVMSALNTDVQGVHAAALPDSFKPPGPEAFSPAAAADVLARPDNLVFIAEVDEAPAGYAYAEVRRVPETAARYAYEVVHLHHLSVRPDYRRQGVGQRLLDAVRSAGEEVGIALLTLDVWSFNESARAFFHRHGFKPYNERLWNR
jgi:ribosomal protein S18 acetylase RimI-like enzyme